MSLTKTNQCESSSQGDVLNYMEENPVWLNTKQIADGLGITSREKIAKFLRQLEKFKFVDRKRTKGSNELQYRIKK